MISEKESRLEQYYFNMATYLLILRDSSIENTTISWLFYNELNQ